jgi:predicted RNA-binding protein with TRAM domain
MVEISDDLLCLYTAEIDTAGETYTIEVPKREIEQGQIDTTGTHRVAILPTDRSSSRSQPDRQSPSRDDHSESPPVDEGDVVDVEIESLGDQGDGIARVGPGYVVIVADTEVGERVSVRITEAQPNVAFADVVERYDRDA